MKRVAAAGLAVSMVAGLTACGPTGKPEETKKEETKAEGGETSAAADKEDAAASDGEVTLRFSWWGGDARHKATEAACQAFMEKYPNIKVECEYGAWDGWAEKVATQLSGGTAPDLMQVNWNWLYQFSSDGSKFVDLTQFADVINMENYPADLLEQCVVGGKQQAIPIGTTGKCFYWNKTTFDKAGIALPTSWDELIAAGTTFKEKLGDEYYPLAMYEYERMLLMMYYLEGKYGKEWAENNTLNYSLEEVKEGLEFINSLEDAHVLPSIAQLKGDGATVLEKNPGWINGQYASASMSGILLRRNLLTLWKAIRSLYLVSSLRAESMRQDL